MDCSICIVNFNTDEILKVNLDLLNIINPDCPLFIVENSPFKYKDKYKATYLPGIPQSSALFTPNNIKGKQPGKFDPGRHHGLAVESALKLIETKHVLILDADFLVLQKLDSFSGPDIIGAPHLSKSQHASVGFADLPTINRYPSNFFCLINRQKVKPILLDYDKADACFYHEHKDGGQPYMHHLIDTTYPLRQIMYRYRWEGFVACAYSKCCECAKIPSEFFGIGRPLERFFYKNRLAGLHFHLRNHTRPIGLIDEALVLSDQTFYHPISNYLKA